MWSQGWKGLPVSPATETADKPRPVEEGSPGAPGWEPSPTPCSQGSSKSCGNLERGSPGAGERPALLRVGLRIGGGWGGIVWPPPGPPDGPTQHTASLWSRVGNLTVAGLAGAAGISPGHSPLQGLINCLKEILEPGPQGPEGPRSVPPPPTHSLGASQLTRAELGPKGPPWAGESLQTYLLGPRFLSPWRAPVALCRYFSVNMMSSLRILASLAAPVSQVSHFWSQMAVIGE